MEVVDVIWIGLLLWAAWRGYQQGLWMGLAGLVGLVLGIWTGLTLAEKLQAWLAWGPSSIAVRALFFICIFVLSILLIRMAARIVKAVLNLTPLSWMDSLLGATFSVLVWGSLLSVSLWVLQETIGLEHSLIGTLLHSTGTWIAGWFGTVGLHA